MCKLGLKFLVIFILCLSECFTGGKEIKIGEYFLNVYISIYLLCYSLSNLFLEFSSVILILVILVIYRCNIVILLYDTFIYLLHINLVIILEIQ